MIGRHVPSNNNSQGWGVAALVIALAIAVNVWATWIHNNTYRNPLHPASREPTDPPRGQAASTH